MEKRHRVFVVDDDEQERKSLGRLISDEADLEICGEANDARSGLNEIRASLPDIALIDLSLKESSGFDLIRSIKLVGLNTPILVVSLHDETTFAERVLQEGGRGYLMKQDAAQNVVAAIRTVLGGEIYLSDRIRNKRREQ